MTPAKLSRYTGKVIMILVPEQTQRVFVIFGFERLMFLPNDDRSIDNGLASHLCLDISRIQEHKTAAISHDKRGHFNGTPSFVLFRNVHFLMLVRSRQREPEVQNSVQSGCYGVCR